MKVPEHKIRTAIKAYLDAGGDPEFYILPKRHANDSILCIKTKQKLADHEYTVLYDSDGNKYLMLEKFDITQVPKIEMDDDIKVQSSVISAITHRMMRGK